MLFAILFMMSIMWLQIFSLNDPNLTGTWLKFFFISIWPNQANHLKCFSECFDKISSSFSSDNSPRFYSVFLNINLIKYFVTGSFWWNFEKLDWYVLFFDFKLTLFTNHLTRVTRNTHHKFEVWTLKNKLYIFTIIFRP